MKMSSGRFKTIVLSFIWLAVVCGAAALAIARRDQHGIETYIIVGMAALMLVVFVVAYLPRRMQTKPSAELLGKLSTGLLIFCVILFLAVALVKGYKSLGIIGGGALLLFLVTFVRIFVSYVRDFNKQPRRRKAEEESESKDDDTG